MNQDTLNEKKAIVDEIVNKAKESQTVIVAEYRGLKVSELEELRRALRQDDASLFVYKNSLVERAAKTLGYDGLNQYLEGPNAVVFSKDVAKGAKTVAKYVKKFQDVLKIKGGVVEGKVVDANTINDVAKIPSRDGLYSMFLSCLQAPIRQFACAVKAVADAK